MGALEEGGKVATGVVEGLKSQPLALALIVINLIFLLGGGYMLFNIMDRVRDGQVRHAQMLTDLMKDCGAR